MPLAQSMGAKAQNRSKEPSWALIILLSGIISGVLLFAIGWYYSLPQGQKDSVFHNIMTGDVFPGLMGLDRSKVLLVMGVDMPPRGSKADYRGVRTDTMMLVRLDRPHKRINIVSVPRDSKVRIADRDSVDKINAAFTYGGPELSEKTIEQNFGVHVDHYLVINLRGVKEVVDALGGIDLYIEKPMKYHDGTAHLDINLQPGKHHLDGHGAEGFLRFRHDAYGDIGRIRRQQSFMNAVLTKLKEPSVLLKIKPLIDASNKYMMTDMDTADLARTVMFAKDVNRSRFQVATLPGRPSIYSPVSYWLIDPPEAEAVLNRLIVGMDTASPDATEQTGPGGATVGLLYMASEADRAKQFAKDVESQGFRVSCKQVVRRSGTKLLTHNARLGGDMENTLRKAGGLGDNAQLIFSPHGTTFESNSCGHTDFTVVLGDDTTTRSAQR